MESSKSAHGFLNSYFLKYKQADVWFLLFFPAYILSMDGTKMKASLSSPFEYS